MNNDLVIFYFWIKIKSGVKIGKKSIKPTNLVFILKDTWEILYEKRKGQKI